MVEPQDVVLKTLMFLKDTFVRTFGVPVQNVIDANLVDLSTMLATFVVRKVSGKFYRVVVFTTGISYSDNWMEEAFYGVIYRYNDITSMSRLELTNKEGYSDGSMLHAQLADGPHDLKYRDWNVVVNIATARNASASGRVRPVRTFAITTTTKDPNFINILKQDLLSERNAIVKINTDSPTINAYRDGHDADGSTWWYKLQPVEKRPLSTIYLPREQKELLVNTINRFFADKALYRKLGCPWNLKILLYGESGTGKSSIARMIATEWHRNLYDVTGGKNSIFLAEAIECTDNSAVQFPLFSIQDMDRISTINEVNVHSGDDSEKSVEAALRQNDAHRKLLNALDGVVGGEGKIVVCTANDISKFSPTLLRDGRFDLKMHIGYINEEVFADYVKNIYEYEIPGRFYLKSDHLTIADLNTDVKTRRLTLDEFLRKWTSDSPLPPKPKAAPVSKPEKKDKGKKENVEPKKAVSG